MADADLGASGGGAKRQRSRQVCTGCRQNKLRCDAGKMFPSGCSRCTASSLICRIDPDFKRTRKRIGGDAASPATPGSSHLQNSATLADAWPAPPQLALPLAHIPAPADGTASVLSRVSQLHNGNIGVLLSAPVEYTLGQVRASREVVDVLLAEFFEFYHHQCPLLIRARSPAIDVVHDPLLFWTILSIASRQPILQPNTQTRFQLISHNVLASEVKQLAATVLVDPSQRTLGTVQALLLLCHWPLPATSMKSDLTAFYSALASTIAVELGMHRPLHSHEFHARRQIDPASEEGQERRIAWHVCHLVCYWVAADQGLPSQVQDDWANTTASTSVLSKLLPPPSRIIQLLHLARFSDRVSRSLGGNADSASGVASAPLTAALLRTFSSELTDLERSLGAVSDDISLVALLTRVRLCAYGLQMDGGPPGARSQLASECYVGCIRTIDIVLKMDPFTLKKWPLSMQWGFGQACSTLIALVLGPDTRKFDTTAALVKVSEAHRISLLLAVEQGDLLSRFANFLGSALEIARDKLEHGGPAGPKDPTVSRYGIPNWTADIIGTAKDSMEAQARQEQAVAHVPLPGATAAGQDLDDSYSHSHGSPSSAFDPDTHLNPFSQDALDVDLASFWNQTDVADPLFWQHPF